MEFIKIGEISNQIRGVSYSKDDASDMPKDGYLPILRANNIQDTGLNFNNLVYVPSDKISEKQKIKNGDVLIAASSGSIDIVGKSAATSEDIEAGFGAFCKILRPNSSLVNFRYFAHYFLTSDYRKKISNLAEGANINNLRNEHLDNLIIPLPPLSEQKRIADILDKTDNLRQKRQQSIAKLDELLQATFIDMFGDPVTNPKGWEIDDLGKLTLKIGSGSTPTGGDSAYKDEGITLIRSLNVHDNKFIYKNLAFIDEQQAGKLKNVIVKENDVLLNITGASVARCCIVPADVLPARVNQHVSILRVNEKLTAEFLASLLTSQPMKNHLLNKSGSGATREALTKAQLLALKIILPTDDLQLKWKKFAQQIQTQKNFLTQQLTQQNQLFQSLQQQAFNGTL